MAFTHFNDENSVSYNSDDGYNQTLVVEYIRFGLLDSDPKVFINASPNVGELETDFWTRVGVLIAEELSFIDKTFIPPIAIDVAYTGMGGDTATLTFQNSVVMQNVGYSKIFVFISNVDNDEDSFDWCLQSITNPSETETYNSQVRTTQEGTN